MVYVRCFFSSFWLVLAAHYDLPRHGAQCCLCSFVEKALELSIILCNDLRLGLRPGARCSYRVFSLISCESVNVVSSVHAGHSPLTRARLVGFFICNDFSRVTSAEAPAAPQLSVSDILRKN